MLLNILTKNQLFKLILIFENINNFKNNNAISHELYIIQHDRRANVIEKLIIS